MDGILNQQQPQGGLLEFLQSPQFRGFSEGLLAAGNPNQPKMGLIQALGMGGQGVNAAVDREKAKQLEEFMMQMKMQQMMQQGQITPYQREYLDIQRERNNLDRSGVGKPPTGYQFKEDGTLTPIPGGPAEKLSPEAAAKSAQVDNAKANIPKIRELLADKYPGPIDFALNRGDVGEGKRLVKSSIEAYLRATSGAAVPEQEVERAAELYLPNPTDTQETRARKVDQLERFLSGIDTNMALGRGEQTTPAATGGWQIEEVQ